jgi:D-amino peptidase
VKIYISSDMEGTAGIVDWRQCVGPGQEYETGRRLLLDEVNAAIDGAAAAGATEFLVNDSHSVMQNLPPNELHRNAAYLAGTNKPSYMMEGLDSSYDGIFFVSYHAAMGTPGALSHTYNPRAIHEVRINGTVTGESGLNALVAQHFGVPVLLVTGDQYVRPEAEPFCPRIKAAEVKRSVSRFAAESLHPASACERIRAAAADAARQLSDVDAPRIEMPATVEIEWRTTDMAELAAGVPGVDRPKPRASTLTDDDPLRLYRTFVTLIMLTRSVVE